MTADIRGVFPSFAPDRMRELLATDCNCGPTGHKLLAEAVAASDGVAYNGRVRVSEATRARMHAMGLLVVMEYKEGGWERGMWAATLTPAGRFHHASVTGQDGVHVNGCGGTLGANGDCTGCRQPISMTTGEAARRLEAMPSGPARDDIGGEVWASTFACPTHGRCRASMVTTKKTCAWCGEGLLRLGRSAMEDLP